jgi:hypothetical protein
MRLLMLYRDRRRPPRSVGQIAGAAVLIVGTIVFVAIGAVVALFAALIWLANQR